MYVCMNVYMHACIEVYMCVKQMCIAELLACCSPRKVSLQSCVCMYVCRCMHACVTVCMYVCLAELQVSKACHKFCVCMCACVYVYACLQVSETVNTNTYTHMHTHRHIRTNLHTCSSWEKYRNVFIHIHSTYIEILNISRHEFIHMYTHIQTHTYTCTYLLITPKLIKIIDTHARTS